MSETPEKVVRSEAEWRELLNPEQYRILREKDTERAFTGALTQNHETGDYQCAGCGALLFLTCNWQRSIPSTISGRSRHGPRRPASPGQRTVPDPLVALRAYPQPSAGRAGV